MLILKMLIKKNKSIKIDFFFLRNNKILKCMKIIFEFIRLNIIFVLVVIKNKRKFILKFNIYRKKFQNILNFLYQ